MNEVRQEGKELDKETHEKSEMRKWAGRGEKGMEDWWEARKRIKLCI